MKKIYSLIITSTLVLFGFNANATNYAVQITASSTFSPQTFTAIVGDSVTWTYLAGGTPHTVSSQAGSIPAGAAALSSGTLTVNGSTYGYKITTAGLYGYKCDFHGSLTPFPSGMVGGFSVTLTGIPEPTVSFSTNAYPNPFKDRITVKYNGVDLMEVYNVVGDKIKVAKLSAHENKTEIDLEGMASGIYFYRSYKEGVMVETKKIVKVQ